MAEQFKYEYRDSNGLTDKDKEKLHTPPKGVIKMCGTCLFGELHQWDNENNPVVARCKHFKDWNVSKTPQGHCKTYMYDKDCKKKVISHHNTVRDYANKMPEI